QRAVCLTYRNSLPVLVSSELGEREPVRHLHGVFVLCGKGDADQAGEDDRTYRHSPYTNRRNARHGSPPRLGSKESSGRGITTASNDRSERAPSGNWTLVQLPARTGSMSELATIGNIQRKVLYGYRFHVSFPSNTTVGLRAQCTPSTVDSDSGEPDPVANIDP